jgi:hypothetical protein
MHTSCMEHMESDSLEGADEEFVRQRKHAEWG